MHMLNALSSPDMGWLYERGPLTSNIYGDRTEILPATGCKRKLTLLKLRVSVSSLPPRLAPLSGAARVPVRRVRTAVPHAQERNMRWSRAEELGGQDGNAEQEQERRERAQRDRGICTLARLAISSREQQVRG